MLLCDLTLRAMANQAVASTCSDQSRPFKNREVGFPRFWVSSVLYTFDALQMSDNKFGDHLKPNDNLQLLILFLITLVVFVILIVKACFRMGRGVLVRTCFVHQIQCAS